MPSGPRPTSRPGAGPGRGKPRARPTGRSQAAAKPATTADAAPKAAGSQAEWLREEQANEAGRRRSSLTTRAIALAVVFLILTISYASSLRIYFAQSAEIASTKQEIAERQERIGKLQTDLTRWDNPDYVRTQARTRLGWVLPGEKGFKVIGADGQPLDGAPGVEAAQQPSPPKDAWWDKLWGSVEAADQPAPVKVETKPTKEPTITEKSKPSPSASQETEPSPSASPR
jgi:cell division protein FtsB